jgi:UDP-2,3-diacylglucosamine pyrophosphatase LpxH
MEPVNDATSQRIRRHLPAETQVFLVSDLHLGDGTSSDSFQGKDAELIAFIEHVREAGAHLVIAGDAIDFDQAWFVCRVFKAHGALFRALSSLAEHGRVIYIWGNHDADISFFRDVVRFDVCSSLQIGDEVIVRHGYEYDPFIGPDMGQAATATKAHHLVERLFNTWIRVPIENHYTLAVRVALWLIHKLVLGNHLLRWLGFRRLFRKLHAVDKYWTQAQMGDPQGIFEGVRRALKTGPYRWIVTGHSHLPGRVEMHPDRWYINTGSWTFELTVHDWRKGKQYSDHLYRALLSGRDRHIDFMAWWRENYLGWLRYRVAEEGRIPHIETSTKETPTCA